MLLCDGRPVGQEYITNAIQRTAGFCLSKEVHIQASAGPATEVNVFKVTESVLILNQWAKLTEVTALTNCTDVYADVASTTGAPKPLTKTPGASFSGLTVGAFFTRGHDLTQIYDVLNADEARVMEPTGNKIGSPFFVNQENEEDTFIRFHLTPGADVDFKMLLFFEYITLNGGALDILI